MGPVWEGDYTDIKIHVVENDRQKLVHLLGALRAGGRSIIDGSVAIPVEIIRGTMVEYENMAVVVVSGCKRKIPAP